MEKLKNVKTKQAGQSTIPLIPYNLANLAFRHSL